MWAHYRCKPLVGWPLALSCSLPPSMSLVEHSLSLTRFRPSRPRGVNKGRWEWGKWEYENFIEKAFIWFIRCLTYILVLRLYLLGWPTHFVMKPDCFELTSPSTLLCKRKEWVSPTRLGGHATSVVACRVLDGNVVFVFYVENSIDSHRNRFILSQFLVVRFCVEQK